MKRKFECNKCKKQFEADDAEIVLCPQCGSDNVEYAHFRISSKVWKGLCTIIVVLIIGIILFHIDWKQNIISDEPYVSAEDSLTYSRDTTYITETGLALPPVINIEDVIYEEGGYSFSANVENPPVAEFYFAIIDVYNNKIIAKSNNGKFDNVPYSNADGGMYGIALFEISADTIICSIEKTGFIKQSSVSSKMSTHELQIKIDKREISLMGVGENDYLCPNYELKVIGLSSDAVNVPSTLGEVFDKLDNEIWKSVKVSSLEYDDMNRISKIILNITEY